MERKESRKRGPKPGQKYGERDEHGRSDADPNRQQKDVDDVDDENLGINAPRGE
jgi:hypothetical protein